MTKNALLRFMKKLLENGSEEKSTESLKELLAILEAQNAEKSMTDLVRQTIRDVREAKEEAKKPNLTEEDLMIARRRADDRRRREEEMANRGRC